MSPVTIITKTHYNKQIYKDRADIGLVHYSCVYSSRISATVSDYKINVDMSPVTIITKTKICQIYKDRADIGLGLSPSNSSLFSSSVQSAQRVCCSETQGMYMDLQNPLDLGNRTALMSTFKSCVRTCIYFTTHSTLISHLTNDTYMYVHQTHINHMRE